MKKPGFGRLMVALLVACAGLPAAAKDIHLLNVSYDPTRELYEEINHAFAKAWKDQTGDTVMIQQ